MFLVNSRLGSFTAPPKCSRKDHIRGDPFSRSYGANLPSSLTWFLSRALVCSTILPVSVLVRIPNQLVRSFSWQHGLNQSVFPQGVHVPSRFRIVPVDLPARTPYVLRPSKPKDGWPSLLRHSITQTLIRQYRNVDLLPITYAFRP